MRNILKWLFIIQEVDNDWRNENGYKRLGKGYSKAYRLNPYNPLSYLTIIVVLIVGVLMFGVIGIWNEVDSKPFRWS
jgi:hypothetical protein